MMRFRVGRDRGRHSSMWGRQGFKYYHVKKCLGFRVLVLTKRRTALLTCRKTSPTRVPTTSDGVRFCKEKKETRNKFKKKRQEKKTRKRKEKKRKTKKTQEEQKKKKRKKEEKRTKKTKKSMKKKKKETKKNERK